MWQGRDEQVSKLEDNKFDLPDDTLPTHLQKVTEGIRQLYGDWNGYTAVSTDFRSAGSQALVGLLACLGRRRWPKSRSIDYKF